MGFYINPPADDRETALHGKSAWLEENGVKLDDVPKWEDIPADCCAVCCVNSGPFEAAAIAYKPGELDYFNGGEPGDTRPKKWFLLEKTIAVKFGNILMEDFV